MAKKGSVKVKAAARPKTVSGSKSMGDVDMPAAKTPVSAFGPVSAIKKAVPLAGGRSPGKHNMGASWAGSQSKAH
jgi:hypothetical protein